MRMKKIILTVSFSVLFFPFIWSQTGGISGQITDSQTNETLTGATIVIQGTTKGTIADFDGNYKLDGLSAGSYNVVFNFISYNQKILKIEITAGKIIEQNISLDPAVICMEEVVVKKVRNKSNDIALISDIKSKEGIVSGISAEQISKTQDKDAAEIVRRVPGITITDGRFVIVRGLSERYNSILLNGTVAPSFEADRKAFALDVIPSGMIENILIYKSPSPEYPADFAGAVIDVVTKKNADKNELKLSYSAGFAENASFNQNYQTYSGGKLDWLGFDDGTRDIPASVPTTKEFYSLYEWNSLDDYYSDMGEVINISKDFNNTWTTENHTPFLDQTFSITGQRRFTAGKASFGNITAVNYKYSNSFYEARRTEYENYDEQNDIITYDFNYLDTRSAKAVNLGLIHNWIIIFGRNQKIEFNNFFNNLGESSSSHRAGDYTYNSENARLSNLRYKQRSIYSGQLSGKHGFNNGNTNFDWLGGFSTTFNKSPDNRIIKYTREIGTENPFEMKADKEVNVFNGGRVTQALHENIFSVAVNFNQKIYIAQAAQPITIKAGGLKEIKYRDFDNRLFGIITPRGTQALDLNLQLPPEELLITDNFFIDSQNPNRTGFAYKDGTQRTNTYQANQNINAGYLALKIPVTEYVDIFGGVRAEQLNRKIYDIFENPEFADSAVASIDTINFYPSVNFTVKISKKHQFRLSYGKTVNHPEFREISPAAFYDFDLNAIVHGNEFLTDCYIDNYDIRYEWYPNPGEMISLSAFYKDFTNPIELFLVPAGSGFDYWPFNTEEAVSKGLELDIRKRLTELENSGSFLRYLKDITLVANASVIESKINTNLSFARESSRVMQGQSPYIINLGIYYDNDKSGTKVNLSYNKIGKRIVFAGTPSNPHTWELPRNTLDINLSQKIGKRAEVTFAVKDLLNNPVKYVQYFGTGDWLELPTLEYTTNRKISASFSMTF